MRKIFTFFAAILTAYGVNAQMVLPTVESGAEPEPIATEVVDMTTTFTTAYSLADVQVAAQKALKKAPARKVAAQFPAEWTNFIVSYKTAVSTLFADGGGLVAVRQVDGNINIGNLFVNGTLISANPTETEGVYEIPNFQVVGTTTEYGDVVVVPFKYVETVNESGATVTALVVDSTATGVKVVATSANSLQFEGMFGFIVKEGENAGGAFYVAQAGKIIPSNAVMTWKQRDDETTYKTLMNISQDADTLTFVNFGGGGLEFSSTLTSRKSVKIGGYPCFYSKVMTAFKAFNIAGIEYYNENTGKVYLYNTGLYATGSADSDNTLEWGAWSAYYGSYTAGFMTEGQIQCNEAIAWPEPKMAEGLKGNGTEESPYLIENNDDWKAVAAASQSGVEFYNQFVKLTADLDFSNDSVPAIGSIKTPFYGTFDGDNHTVTAKLTTNAQSQGLIGVLSGGTVKNLNASGEFNFGSTFSAPVVGTAFANSTIENCNSNAHVTVSEVSTSCGGVVGYCNFGSVIKNCQFSGVLDINTNKTSSYIGGVCGYGYGVKFSFCSNIGTMNVAHPETADCVAGVNGYAVFTEYDFCYNTADITASRWVAGINGYNHTAGSCTARNCYNTGNITSTMASGNYAAAGCFSYMMYGGIYENCFNQGNVTAQGAHPYVGGVFAHYRGSADLGAITISNCFNTGNITANGGNYVGGLAGFAYAANIDNCYNTGKIVSNGTAYNKGSSVGGLIGQYQSFTADTTFFTTAITRSFNIGEVVSNSTWAGGLVGNFATHNSIINCWNAGNVTALNRSAGLVGYSAFASRIEECFNVGDVTLTATTKGTGSSANSGGGGIIGYASGDVSDCYNAGTVTGNGRMAGIFAWPYHNTSASLKDDWRYTPSIRNSVNYGKIVADADSCGNIVGIHTFNNGTMWRTPETPKDATGCYVNTDTIENVMYLEGMCPGAITGEATNPEIGYSARVLCTILPSDKFCHVGDYCFPVLIANADENYARIYSVAVVPADNEPDPAYITRDFNIGHPAGVNITSSYAGVTIDGNSVKFDGQPYEGEITFTLTNQRVESSRKKVSVVNNLPIERKIVVNVKYDGAPSGVVDVNANKEIKQVRYYNLSGALIPDASGACIQVVTYTDGTTQAKKILK